MGESLSIVALLRGVPGVAQDLWVGLDLSHAIAVSMDEVPGVVIVMDEIVQRQAQLLDIDVNQPGENIGIDMIAIPMAQHSCWLHHKEPFPGKVVSFVPREQRLTPSSSLPLCLLAVALVHFLLFLPRRRWGIGSSPVTE